MALILAGKIDSPGNRNRDGAGERKTEDRSEIKEKGERERVKRQMDCNEKEKYRCIESKRE